MLALLIVLALLAVAFQHRRAVTRGFAVLVAPWTFRQDGLCRRCRVAPRRPDLDVPPGLLDYSLVNPRDYCSVDCMKAAAGRG